MERPPDTIAGRSLRAAALCVSALALAVVMTWPLASGMSRLGRTTTMDGLYSIWNISWVARTIVADPLHLLDANIFHPHRAALTFSEANILGGVVAAPAWWLTRNPYVAHNTALLFAFSSTLAGTWLLVRRLSGSSSAASVSAILFAFCPYFFSHSAHIQLLMAGGMPLAMLALHRLADAPSTARGLVLGVTLAAQALACAYYGIFAGLMVGYGAIFMAATRRLWRAARFWGALGVGAVTSILCVAPFFLPYVSMQRDAGFRRTLGDAARYSATLASYLASPAHAHQWIFDFARTLGWNAGEVLFPGLLVTGLGAAGFVLAMRRQTAEGPGFDRDREAVLLYGSLGALALWASFGPPAGLYTALFHAVPLFTFLRAPSRFGLVVSLALAILAGFAVSRWLPSRGARTVAALLAAAGLAELNVLPFPWERALPVSPGYALLARMPRAPLAEFPFYGERVAFPLHAQYMVLSAAHWMPLVNGYSDHIPRDFREAAAVLDSFPSNDTFAILQRRRVRYIGVHWDRYGPRAEEIRTRLQPFLRHLRPLAANPAMSLFEIVSFP
ncbi:MAG: hypothetical protein M3545_08955 [Acidobacteriota bacterium]|nr:hypothetical protein [Acidobacteriota bacterium]